MINKFFKVGNVTLSGSNLARYRVRSREELKVIIDHFKKYPLRTTKAINFAYFCEIFNEIGNKTHTSIHGFLRLVALVNMLNKPLSDLTLNKLSNLGILPNVEFKPPVLNKNISLNPQWISGFIAGEGSFTYFTRTRKNSKGDIVKDYTLAMEVSQDSKDLFILNLIKDFFQIGKVYSEKRGITKYRLTQKNEILSMLIPYFENNPLLGRKALQFSTWIKIVDILGPEQIRTKERDRKVENLIKNLSEGGP